MKTGGKAGQATKRKAYLESLVRRCMVFADRNGKVVSKSGSPMHSSLRMKYEEKDLIIEFDANRYAQGNGGCWLKVRHKGVFVLKANGNFMTEAFNIRAKSYISGDWEKKIPVKFNP